VAQGIVQTPGGKKKFCFFLMPLLPSSGQELLTLHVRKMAAAVPDIISPHQCFKTGEIFTSCLPSFFFVLDVLGFEFKA
jgi:hypothetical protein